jgi:hypothetical protein
MTKFTGCVLASLLLSLATACGGADAGVDEHGGGSSGVRITGTNGRLSNTKLSPAPLPTPTTTGQEPAIVDFYINQTSPTNFELVAVVSGTMPLDELHIEIGGEHYVVDLSGALPPPLSPDACDLQGVVCTDACLAACGCLSCDDSTFKSALAGACAATCSTPGVIGSEPYTNEAVFADIIYNGYTIDGTTINGTLSSVGASCSAAQCTELAAPTKMVSVDLVGINYDEVLGQFANVQTQVSTPATPDEPASISSPFASATVRVNDNCDPAACRP